MLKNYFKTARRNLLKNKVSSIINIGGLAIGMTVAMLIGLWIHDELSYNKYHQHYNRIAQVMQHQTSNGTIYSQVAIPFPLGKELQTKYGSDFKHVVMASWQGQHILTHGDTKLSQTGMYMDAGAPSLLSLNMLKGNYDAFKDPHSIILSEQAAKAIFGDKDPIGQLMKIDNKMDAKVTGVYEDLPRNTYFNELKFIAPWDLYVPSEQWIIDTRDQQQWGNNSFQIFIQLADNSNLDAVNKRIAKAKYNNQPEEDKKYKAEVFLHPMKDWHLRSHWENGVLTGGLIEYVWMFAMVGIFVLLLACINFMNLSTARSEKRAREVGVRKAIGSLRSQLIGQFYSESFLVVVFAFVLAIILAQLLLPWFNTVADKKMSMLWASPYFWIMGIGFTIITALVAGSYPALYLSSFQPVKVLKGTFKAGRFAAIPRKVLVVLQFSISLALIIGTIIVYNQIQHSKDRPIGYDRNGLVMVQMRSPDFYGKLDVLRTELKGTGAVQEFAEASSPLTAIWSSNGGFSWQGKDPNLDAEFSTIWVTHDYGKTIGWQFTDGRDFSRDFATDSLSVVINESAVKFMNVQNPVGMQIDWGTGEKAGHFKIVGVVKDMVMDSPYGNVDPAIFLLTADNVNWMIMKLNPTQSASSSIASIEKIYKKLIPSAPFDYQFADQQFAYKFAAEERIGKLAGAFAVLAIFISCLGLFGMASFMAEQRVKEIGVRKVLGASVFNLWQLLSKEFVLLVLISIVIATPLAWYYMHGWLNNYVYRSNISWGVFAAAGIGGLAITILTVSFQSIKAALANPVKSLRSE